MLYISWLRWASWSRDRNGLNTKMPSAAMDVQERLVDFTFPVERWEKQRDGTMSVHVRGTLNDIDIGLIIDILPEWRQQDVLGKYLVLYWGKVRYRSLGKPSDRFLNMLVDRFGLPARDRRMASIFEFTAIGFLTDPRELESSPVRMKLARWPGPKEAHAEFFTNIDLVQAKMEFREKDPKYRVPIVAALDGG